MKVGIITFHAAFNYGSMLQAWAMQRFNRQQGREVVIVNYRTKLQKHMYAHPLHISSVRDIVSLAYRTLRFGPGYLLKGRRWRLYDSFLRQHLHPGPEADDCQSLRAAYTGLDALICGSDQIWNIEARDFSEVYFGNFISAPTVKIGYAPSLGGHPETLDMSVFASNLRGFRALAVREREGADFLTGRGLYGKVSVVCDPTLLLESADYEPLVAKEPLVAGKYLYYYAPLHRPADMAIAKEEARSMGVKLVCDTGYTNIRHNDPDVTYVSYAGPCEFLNLIKYAAYVSASSYHAIVFAILFNKDFTAINGDTDARKRSLLESLGIHGRVASVSDPGIRPDYLPIDWDSVNTSLASLRSGSSAFLNDALDT